MGSLMADAVDGRTGPSSGPPQRLRCAAALATLAEVVGAGHRDEPIMAMRAYADACLAVAVGGLVDRAMLDRLRALHDDPHLAGLSAAELVLDLSQVRDSVPGLTRVLDRLRRQRTQVGCRVELQPPSPSLAGELDGATLSEAFTIFAAVHRSPAWAGYLSPAGGGAGAPPSAVPRSG
jgi:hypothetical protein